MSLVARSHHRPTVRPAPLSGLAADRPVHLRMFEMAKDWARKNTNYVVVGAYLSPVGDAYKKKGLALAKHRVTMCELAVNTITNGSVIMVDTWEALQVRILKYSGGDSELTCILLRANINPLPR